MLKCAKIEYIAELRSQGKNTDVKLIAEYLPYNLFFRFPAATSRGVLMEKAVYYIRVLDPNCPECAGIGECGALPGLSPDDLPDYEMRLRQALQGLMTSEFDGGMDKAFELAHHCAGLDLPSIRFGLETALLDLYGGGRRQLFEGSFANGESRIPINGLVWMGDAGFMAAQVEEKLAEGYACIKIKVGSVDLDQELAILRTIRNRFSESQMLIRLDANGAFGPSEAVEMISRYAEYGIHSIEQPIRPGQCDAMYRLCHNSPIPIALDEELIGHTDAVSRKSLLERVGPQYIVLKPSLLGGFAACDSWIELADSLGCGWWITSMLESNIGLNAIAQFTSTYVVDVHQGLGTGQLYRNNIISPLSIGGGTLYLDLRDAWDLSPLDNWKKP